VFSVSGVVKASVRAGGGPGNHHKRIPCPTDGLSAWLLAAGAVTGLPVPMPAIGGIAKPLERLGSPKLKTT